MGSRSNPDIAAAAARLIVEEGLEYGAAKQRAARDLGYGTRGAGLPRNDEVEDEVRAYLELFEAESQPAELAELRRVAADCMVRMAPFRPYLTGAVWRGTATRRTSIHLDLYCDDAKSAELALIDMRIDYDSSSVERPRGEPLSVLDVFSRSRALGVPVHVAMTVRDYDDLRGALVRDGQGRSMRGDLAALNALGPT